MGRRREKAKAKAAKDVARATRAAISASPLAGSAAALFAIACIAHVMRPGPAFPAGVDQYWLRGGLLVVAGAFLVAAIPVDFVRELPARCSTLLLRPSPVVFAAIIAATALALSIVFSVYAFDQAPRTSDEFAQLWHAKMLVHGHLSLPPDVNPEFFAMDNVVDTGRWYSQYPIGGPAVLAIGVLFGVPWLVNPVLAAIAVVAFYHFARRAYGETEGRAIAALLAVTPMVLMMSGTQMNHVPVYCLAACALAALVEWEAATTPRRAAMFAALVGIAIGLIATIRPLDAVVVALVVGFFQMRVVAGNRARVRELAIQAAAGAIAIAPLLYANWATTGSAFRFGYDVLWGPGHTLGFHTDPHGGVHTAERAFGYATTYVTELNVFLSMWPVPVLAVIVLGLALLPRLTKWDVLLLGLFWAQVIAYSAYWYEGQFLGPRFLFTVAPVAIVFLARAPFAVAARASGLLPRAALVLVFAGIAVSWIVPVGRFGVWGMASAVRDTRRVLKVNIAQMVRDSGLTNALVFLREPVGSRLQHRMWGLGMSRSDAAQMLAKSDACSLLDAIRAAEADSVSPREAKLATLADAAAPYAPTGAPVRTADPTVHISSAASVTPECRAEFDGDARLGVATFGSALPLEPIGPDGRIDGDVVFVADLGERNELLRRRFGSRKWYRLSVIHAERTKPPTISVY